MITTNFQFSTLLIASLALAVATLIACAALRLFRTVDHRLHRLVWIVVLIQGVLFFRYTIELPVLNSDLNGSAHADLNPVAHWDGPASRNEPSPEFSGLTHDNSHVNDVDFVSSVAGETADESSQGLVDTRQLVDRFGWISGLDIWSLGLIAWCAGIVALLIGSSIRYSLFLRRIRRSSHRHAVWQDECDKLSLSLNIKSKVRLLGHDDLGPLLYWSPQGYSIVVPEDSWSKMSAVQRATVLRHELEHLRRRDILISTLAYLVAVIHWFNPFAWLALRQLNQAAEWACDDAAAFENQDKSTFAQALLSLSVTTQYPPIGFSAFGTSDLKTRIERIVDRRRSNPLSLVVLPILAVGIMILGSIDVRLVSKLSAGESFSVTNQPLDDEFDARVSDFADRLSLDTDLARKLQKIAGSPAGRIAIGNQIEGIEGELRSEATQRVLPEFFENRVDNEFRVQMMQDVRRAQEHIAVLHAELKSIQNQLNGQSNADQLFARFLKAPNAAVTLYFGELREQLEPGDNYLMEHLGRFIARDPDGKLVVRESVKAPLTNKLKRFENVDEHISFLKNEMRLIADEIFEKDELHSQLKERLKSSRGVAFVMAMAFENEQPIDRLLEEYLESLDYFFVDEPEGLVVDDEAKDHLIEAMADMDHRLKKIDVIRVPMRKIVAAIDQNRGQAETLVKGFLGSEIGLAVMSEHIDIGSGDPRELVEQIREEIFEEHDGGIRVQAERQEEVSQLSRELLRATRQLRRRLKMVDNRTAEFPDSVLKGLTDSNEAKLILIEKVQRFVEQRRFDGWPNWLEEHFELVDGKYVIRKESIEMIEELIADSNEIEAELANDDF